MRSRYSLYGVMVTMCIAAYALPGILHAERADDSYLRWTAKQAEAVGKVAYQRGRVGSVFDARLLKTERAQNYKLAATWLTPDVIRATARLLQLGSRLSDDETRALVSEAESVSGTVVMIEIDPREGSGVIPNDWIAFLQPKGRPQQVVRGTLSPQLRSVKALSGVLRRKYDYDRFWVTFPLAHQDATPLFGPADGTAELIVRIVDREGRVEWPVPGSLSQVVK